MLLPGTIADYLRQHSDELGNRILESYPPLHAIDDPPSPLISKLLRKPYPAQTLAIMGLVRRWQQARAGAVIAECGTGKTLISLGAVYTHAEGRPFTAIAMAPPQLVEKWCREAFLTLPRVRVFIIDGLRTPTNSKSHHGVNEVKLRNKRIVREGLKTSLRELRLRKSSSSAASVGIQFALLRHCSWWVGIGPSLGTSGGTPTRLPAAAAIKAALSILTAGLRSTSARRANACWQWTSRR